MVKGVHLMDIREKIVEIKKPIEANIVGIMYKNPDLFHEHKIELSSFHNIVWRLVYKIGFDMAMKGIEVIDEVAMMMFLSDKDSVKSKLDEFGGWDLIEQLNEMAVDDNFYGYMQEFHKYNTLLELHDKGFEIEEKFNELTLSNAEEIYSYYEAKLNDVFSKVGDSSVRAENLCDNVVNLVYKLNEGQQVALPFAETMPTLNDEIGGLHLGQLYILGAHSGNGKTTTLINTIVSSVLKNNEKLLILANEETADKFRSDILVYICNNIILGDKGEKIGKKRLRKGNFNEKEMELLLKGAEYMEQLKSNRNITFISMENWDTDRAIKIIKKYANLGVKYVEIDTLKESTEKADQNVWMQLKMDSVKLANLAKDKNINITFTYQLSKSSSNNYYLSQGSLGNSRSVIDTASVCLLTRPVFSSEFEGGRSEIKPFRIEGKTKLPLAPLDPNKNYLIFFLTKNRFGSSKTFEVIVEVNLATNEYKEYGLCCIPFSEN